mgnify:CR=1 FL=1
MIIQKLMASVHLMGMDTNTDRAGKIHHICGKRLCIRALRSRKPFNVLVALTPDIQNTLPAQEYKVRLNPGQHRPDAELPKGLAVLLAVQDSRT